MATSEIVNLFDDLDPRITNGVETVTFYNPLTGVKMEIELGEANRKHFDNHLAKLDKYINAARQVEQPPAKAVAVQKKNQNEIREWARANGYDVGERGRIKAEILEAYFKAQETPAQQDSTSEVEVASEQSAESEPTAEQLEEIEHNADSEPLDDAAVLKMMQEIENEGREVTVQALAERAHN